MQIMNYDKKKLESFKSFMVLHINLKMRVMEK